MKELTRFLVYTLATVAMILFVIMVARFDDDSPNLLPLTALIVVVILPVIVGIFMGRREKSRRDAEAEAETQRRRTQGGR